MVLFASTISNAQTLQEAVYLKNGSIIKGTIIEQVPNEALKIKTADGSIFVYQMSEVEKITKIEKEENLNLDSRKKNAGKGYRGFIDLGSSIGVGSYKESRLEFSTSHGYQIVPCFFAGMV